MTSFGSSRLRSIGALSAFAIAGLCRLAAQGGPPMITDDPGTPGDKKWEINLGWTEQRTPGQTEVGLPQLDANYGLGDRIELNYVTNWEINQAPSGSQSGWDDSLLGVKWRFYDAGEHGWQASVFPQCTFPTPGTHSDKRGVADDSTSLLAPFEMAKDFDDLSVGFDCGHLFSSKSSENGWMGGIVVGREIVKGWELDAETHLNASERLGRAECILNFGSRIDLTEHVTLMLALGRDVSNDLGPRLSLMSYLGLQLVY